MNNDNNEIRTTPMNNDNNEITAKAGPVAADQYYCARCREYKGGDFYYWTNSVVTPSDRGARVSITRKEVCSDCRDELK